MLLEFAEGTSCYVPIAKIDLVQKYVGGGKAEPELSKLGGVGLGAAEGAGRRGGRRPGRRDDRAPGRARQPAGHRLSRRDTDWQAEFEAAFPYQETPDQLTAIDEIKARHGSSRGRWTG